MNRDGWGLTHHPAVKEARDNANTTMLFPRFNAWRCDRCSSFVDRRLSTCHVCAGGAGGGAAGGAGADPSLVVDPEACVYCVLKLVFTSYLYSEERIIPPDALRHALAILNKNDGRFQVRLIY